MPTVLWLVVAGAVLAVFSGSRKREKTENPEPRDRKQPIRIDHPHYYEADDHECSVCGARFRENDMTCPRCRTKFRGIKEDEDEFIEEVVLWEEDEENDS